MVPDDNQAHYRPVPDPDVVSEDELLREIGAIEGAIVEEPYDGLVMVLEDLQRCANGFTAESKRIADGLTACVLLTAVEGRPKLRSVIRWCAVPAGLAVAGLSYVAPANGATAAQSYYPAVGHSDSALAGTSWTAKSWGALLPPATSENVKVTLPNIVQIAASATATYALTSSGQVYAWGLGVDGALGDGSDANSLDTPVLVDLPVPIASLANPAPFKSEMAVATDGTVYGWGTNDFDEFCLTSDQTDIETPVQLPLSGVTVATGQGAHALYDEGGTIYVCGKGAGGALGDGSRANSSSPVEVDLPGPASAVMSSWENSGALVNGTYYDWGYNRMGQLGDGTTTSSDVPVKVNLPGQVAEVFQGGDYNGDGETMALLTNGNVFAWGSNGAGELDDGTTTNSYVPVKIPSLKGASEVACGGATCYAILNGKLEGFGYDQNGELRNDGMKISYITSTSGNVAVLP